MHEKLAAPDESHNEKDFLLGLENIAHSHQKGVISLQQNVFLQTRRLHLVILNDNIFAERLHGVHFTGSSLLNKENLSEGASANNRFDDEV